MFFVVTMNVSDRRRLATQARASSDGDWEAEEHEPPVLDIDHQPRYASWNRQGAKDAKKNTEF
jgi:hypothetical protein